MEEGELEKESEGDAEKESEGGEATEQKAISYLFERSHCSITFCSQSVILVSFQFLGFLPHLQPQMLLSTTPHTGSEDFRHSTVRFCSPHPLHNSPSPISASLPSFLFDAHAHITPGSDPPALLIQDLIAWPPSVHPST